MRHGPLIAVLFVSLGTTLAGQDKPAPGKKQPGPLDLQTEHWSVTSKFPALPGDNFEEMIEDFYSLWKRKAGASAGSAEKLKLKLYYDRDEFNALANRSGGYTLAEDMIHLLCDQNYPQSLAASGPRLYLAVSYPKIAARKDVPPWILAGLGQYLSCGNWKDGKLELEGLRLPLNAQSVLSFQNLVKSNDWWAFEKSFKAEGREYEIRRRVIDLQAWAAFYYIFNAPAQEGGQGKHAAAVPALLAALNDGRKIEEVLPLFVKTVGGGAYPALETAVKDFFKKLKLETKDREEGNWLIGETAHYTIQVQKGAMNKKTKLNDKQILEDLKFKMELLFEKYSLAFRFQGLLPRKAALKLYMNRTAYIASGAPPGSAAYYNTGTKELVGYEDSEETGIVFQILCHEGCHQFFDLAFPGFYEQENLPMWFSEGLADCFGASRISGRDLMIFTLGGVAAWRVDAVKEALTQGRLPTIKNLLEMNRVPFMTQADLHYPVSWSFVHFLWNYPTLDEGKRGPYSEVVIKLIDGFKVGKPRDEVYKEAFQLKGKPLDYEQLEKEWRAYVKTLKVRK